MTEKQKEEKSRGVTRTMKSPFSPKWSFVIRKMWRMVDKVKLLQAIFSKGRLKNLEKIANQSYDLSKKMKQRVAILEVEFGSCKGSRTLSSHIFSKLWRNCSKIQAVTKGIYFRKCCERKWTFFCTRISLFSQSHILKGKGEKIVQWLRACASKLHLLGSNPGSVTSYRLCDLRQVTQPLCVSFSCVKWGQEQYLHHRVVITKCWDIRNP